MRLWFDEDLTHTLVQVAEELGLVATCNRDRGMLGCTDHALAAAVTKEDFVLVTDNRKDFRSLYEQCDIHPGLIFISASGGRADQQSECRRVARWILERSERMRVCAADLLVDKLVEVQDDRTITISDLPRRRSDR